MKKNIVLFVLFILPIAAYVFFSSGVNNFNRLSTITENIPDVNPAWKSLDGEEVSLEDKITILGFTGEDLWSKSGYYFNLNEKMYDKYSEFEDLQFVYIAPEGTQEEAQASTDILCG